MIVYLTMDIGERELAPAAIPPIWRRDQGPALRFLSIDRAVNNLLWFILPLGYDYIVFLVNTVGGHDTSDAGGGIHIGVPPNDRAGVQHAVTAHLYIIAKHSAYLLNARCDGGITLDRDQALVAFYIGSNGTGTHVGAVAQNAVTHIVVVGHLDIVENDHIFQFYGVAYHAIAAHKGAAPDKGAMPHFGFRTDDAGRADKSGRSDLCAAVSPYLRSNLGIFVRRQLTAQRDDHLLDALQRLPGIGKAGEVIRRQGVAQVVEIMDLAHSIRPFCELLLTYVLYHSCALESIFFERGGIPAFFRQ